MKYLESDPEKERMEKYLLAEIEFVYIPEKDWNEKTKECGFLGYEYFDLPDYNFYSIFIPDDIAFPRKKEILFQIFSQIIFDIEFPNDNSFEKRLEEWAFCNGYTNKLQSTMWYSWAVEKMKQKARKILLGENND